MDEFSDELDEIMNRADKKDDGECVFDEAARIERPGNYEIRSQQFNNTKDQMSLFCLMPAVYSHLFHY